MICLEKTKNPTLHETVSDLFVAEGVGFEPTIRYNRIPDFESGAFDHSAILPGANVSAQRGRHVSKSFAFLHFPDKFFFDLVDRAMLREQSPPSSQKAVSKATGKKSGDERTLAQAINGPKKTQTH